jgi:uncharacterized membrane protein YcfT
LRAWIVHRGTVTRMDAAEDLSHQLWTMRELLQHLVFKLDVQGLLMSGHRTRWVPYAAAEVDAVLEAIDEVEQLRAAASLRVTAQRHLPADIRLTDLIERLGEPWGPLLAQHRVHLLSLQAEIEELSRANHEMARRGLMRSRELIAAMGEGAVDVYDPHGASVSLISASQRLDRTF